MEASIPLAHFKEAARSAEKSWHSSRSQGAMADAASAQVSLASARLELGELDAAQAVAGQAVADCEALGDEHGQSLAEAVLILALVQAGHPAEALAPLARLEARLACADPQTVAAATPYVVSALAGIGRLDRALELAQETLFTHRSLEQPILRVALEAALADLQATRAAWEISRDFATSAVNGASDQGARGTLAKALRVKARVAFNDRQLDDALRAAEQAFALAMQHGAAVQASLIAGLTGEILRAQGDPAALEHFQTMQALADQAGSPALRAVALGHQVRVAPLMPGAAERLQEARRTLEGIATTLSAKDAELFLALPEHAGVMSLELEQPEAMPSFTDHKAMLDVLMRANLDLQGVTTQYARLFKEWTSKSDRLEWLNKLAATISASLDLPEVMSRVIDLTLEITRSQRCFVLLKEGGRFDALLVNDARDTQGKDMRDARFSMSICLRVHETGEPTTILDVSGVGMDLTQSIQALNLQTVMCVPLQCRGKRLGVIYVDSQAAVKTFAADDLTLLEAIANHAAVAIDNALMYKTLHSHTQQLEETLELARTADRLATTDLLTGLRNRRYLTEVSVRELDIARRYDRDLAVILLDVDHFKVFNETHGHPAGDEVLKAVAGVMVGLARQGDMAARLGGEEFLLLCPSTAPAEAVSLAERLREAVAACKIVDAEGLPLGMVAASFGIASYKQGAKTLDELLERAEEALQASKSGGRNQVRVWQPPAALRPLPAD